MKKVHSLSKKRAAGSLSRLMSGDITKEEVLKLNPWKSEDVSYRDEMLGESHLLADLEALADDIELLGLVEDVLDSEKPRRTQWRKGTAIAATVVVSIVATLFVGWQPSTENDGVALRYATKVGEIKTVNLEDGSQLSLNTGTELLVRIGERQRLITLKRGEAYFAVAKDESRPFSVDAGISSVTVLGTEFNIRKHPERLEVAVADGLVAIHPQEELVSATAPRFSDMALEQGGRAILDASDQVQVPAGWSAELDAKQRSLTGSELASVEAITSWRRGVLEFNRAELSKIIQELNRYSGKKILIEDSSVMDLQVSALIRIDSIDNALNVLEKMMPITVTHYFDRIVVAKENENI